ncbi:M15 family metallopeptidase [Cellulosimicrobium cellulans]|uniref:M15 family metallopeptidase n=1 Tax=Cellulosimicrobium cellulans TaxID=1710 RepID=UPI0008492A8D|nr:M15 family metallopeptidase [Cellulosimicrobium cellulans]
MESIAAIAQRVAAIEATIGVAGPAGAVGAGGSRSAAPVGTSSGAHFEQVLGAVVEESAGVDRARTADGVPRDLAAYGNGKVPRSALDEVGTTGHRLWAPASEALEGLLAAAARDGVRIGITDSYRSYEAQVDVAARKGLYSQGGLAAEPGTSPHGWGIAVDLDLDAQAQSWMRTHGGRFGFVEDTPCEPWHWVYRA